MSDGQHATPTTAVLFDFHQTLAQTRSVRVWLDQARAQLQREPVSADDGPALAMLAHIWTHAQELDPDSRRDLSTAEHRLVSLETMTRIGGFDTELAEALYDTLPQQWRLFDDVPAALHTLHEHHIRLAVVSNIGIDIRPMLRRAGVLDLFEAITLSYDVGAVKPERAIFERALSSLSVSPEAALMVGDSWRDDAGAAALGVRCLILPPTTETRRGMDAVVRLVGISPGTDTP